MKLALVFALAASPLVWGSTLYTTIPSGSDSTQTQLSYSEVYSDGSGDVQEYTYYQAIIFQATETGSISSLTINDLFTTGQPTGTFNVNIADDTGDEPGSIVDSFAVPNVSGTAANYTSPSQLNGQLVAGQFYFLELLAPATYPPTPSSQGSAYFTFLTSDSSNVDEFGYYYHTYDGQPQYDSDGGSTTALPLFSVNGPSDVPEPNNALLLGGGLLASFVVGRKLRRA